MFKLSHILTIITLSCTLLSCKNDLKFDISAPTNIKINTNLEAKLTTPLEKETKITYFLDGKEVGKNQELSLDIQNYKLGTHTLKVTVGEFDDAVSKEQSILFLADKKPLVYNYKVINSYPHDRKAFTQGLEFHNNQLFESTGKQGQSVIRKVELTTGKVLKEQPLAKKYFGEGITIVNNKIHQLTWQSRTGFVYDVDTFKPLGTFTYQKSLEGWGLTHDNQYLIKSDGTHKIWFLDPKTHQEKDFIEVYTDSRRVEKLNELEYIDGKIYANIWMQNAIVIINPKNGALEAIINLKGLTKKLDNKTIEGSTDKVLNGIAYNNITKKLYVTGKNWDKLFEIEIVK